MISVDKTHGEGCDARDGFVTTTVTLDTLLSLPCDDCDGLESIRLYR